MVPKGLRGFRETKSTFLPSINLAVLFVMLSFTGVESVDKVLRRTSPFFSYNHIEILSGLVPGFPLLRHNLNWTAFQCLRAIFRVNCKVCSQNEKVVFLS